MRLDADPDALSGDGAHLTSEQCAPRSGACEAPGADPVSASIAAQLTARGSSLEALIEHSGMLREDGGLVTQDAARALQRLDAHNATRFNEAVDSTPEVTPTEAQQISAPVLPEVPLIAAPEMMPGESLAKALHDGGPGPGSVRQFAAHWRSRAEELDRLADRTQRTGLAIDTDWDDDGVQQAGANTRRHGRWLSDMAQEARRLADTADEQADHVQQALDSIPTPAAFDHARRAWQEAWEANQRASGMLSARVAAAAADYAAKDGQATEAGQVLFSAAATTGDESRVPPDPAPPIATPFPPRDTSLGPAESQGGGPRHEQMQKLIPREGGTGSKEVVTGDGEPPDPTGTLGGPLGLAEPPAEPVGAHIPLADGGAVGQTANIAGTLVGAGLGTLGQVASGVMPQPGVAGAPLTALAGLSGIPQVGVGSSSPAGGGMPAGNGSEPSMFNSDAGVGEPFDATTPADVGGAGGIGGATPLSPVGPASPASSSGPVAGSGALLQSGPAGPAAAAGYGGMGMYPPMLPGQSGRDSERNKDLYPDRRVVLRPIPNTEAVFGELERERRPVRRRPAAPEDGSDAR